MGTSQAPFEQFDFSVPSNSQEQRVKLLRHMTDLFMKNADKYSQQQIDVYGNVVMCLVKQAESDVVAELGTKLAPSGNAPKELILTLARHPEIAIAGPVLQNSDRLSDVDLIGIGKAQSQEHLKAISKRAHVTAAVTDVLVQRGNSAVVGVLAGNQGAAFSNAGFTVLAKRAETDEILAVNLGIRQDLPPKFFMNLVSKATEAVRSRLLASIASDKQATARNDILPTSTGVSQDAAKDGDFIGAESEIAQMPADGRYNQDAVAEFVRSGNYTEIVAGIAKLCQTPVDTIKQLAQNANVDGLLVACKAAGMNWPTFNTIVGHRFLGRRYTDNERDTIRTNFLKLSEETAKQVFRFRQDRGQGNGRVN